MYTSPAPVRLIRATNPEFRPDVGLSELLHRSKIAVVLSNGGAHSTSLIPVLASLGVTTIDRPYDDEAAKLVAAIKPALAIVVCDPFEAAGAEMITSIAVEDIGRLMVFDISGAPGGAAASLELGADAAVSPRDDAAAVRATVNALLRRLDPPELPVAVAARSGTVTVGLLSIDHATCEVRDSDELIPLTATEFRVLAHLAAEKDRIQSPGQIMSAIHSYASSDFEARQTVKVYIKRIRRKLEACRNSSVEIVNSRSFGYRLRALTLPQPVPIVRAA